MRLSFVLCWENFIHKCVLGGKFRHLLQRLIHSIVTEQSLQFRIMEYWQNYTPECVMCRHSAYSSQGHRWYLPDKNWLCGLQLLCSWWKHPGDHNGRTHPCCGSVWVERREKLFLDGSKRTKFLLKGNSGLTWVLFSHHFGSKFLLGKKTMKISPVLT